MPAQFAERIAALGFGFRGDVGTGRGRAAGRADAGADDVLVRKVVIRDLVFEKVHLELDHED